MKPEIWIHYGLAVFFTLMAVAYGYWTWLEYGHVEYVGFPALVMTALLAWMIGGYLQLTARSIDDRPEDDPDGEIADLAGEQGFFSPYSWWPLPLAASAAVVFLGLAVGLWICVIGIVLSGVALVGWVYEYYRGAHAH